MKYLYNTMPVSDMGNYAFPVFLDYAENSVNLWRRYERVRRLPEELFLNYVLYHRVNEEEIDRCRVLFYEKIDEFGRQSAAAGYGTHFEALCEEHSDRWTSEGGDWLEACGESFIAQIVNLWCSQEAAYQASDARTASALTVYRCGRGRCGEESVFSVNALRSVGIPARQVYAPRWAHCDDNHAWVELWADGAWHFLGACEPQPELDQGWFNSAASRAMMIHSRWFDGVPALEELPAGGEGMATLLNQTRRYADTVKLEVRVKDGRNHPVRGAAVSFEVLNYAEFFPIAEVMTDEEGKAVLETGAGSLHLDVRKSGLRVEADLNTENCRVYNCILGDSPREAGWQDFVMYAPAATQSGERYGVPRAGQMERTNFALCVEKARKKQYEKERRFINGGCLKFLENADGDRRLRGKLLALLSAKDQTDLRADVLEAHLQDAVRYKDDFPEEIFLSYILNPRISKEVLTPWRQVIRESFSAKEQESFRQNPKEIMYSLLKRIKEEPSRERSSVITTPGAALRLGIASRDSLLVLFVAVARTLGIPARLNPVYGFAEYYRTEHDCFCPVFPEDALTARMCVHVHAGGDHLPESCAARQGQDIAKGAVEWKYYQNWTIARLQNGAYKTLNLDEDCTAADLMPGCYRILTANRLPNGNLFASRRDFYVAENETKDITLHLHEAAPADMLSCNALPDFELTRITETPVHAAGQISCPKGEDAIRRGISRPKGEDAIRRGISRPKGEEDVFTAQTLKASTLAEGRKMAFIWVEAGEEPTEHILNELMEQSGDFAAFAGQIALIVRSADDLEDATVSRCLEVFPGMPVFCHSFRSMPEKLARCIYTEPGRLPLILLTEMQENGFTSIYGTGGYNVGAADMLLRIFRM